jgi:glycosyltransferase involved in cell wall biosynthesis
MTKQRSSRRVCHLTSVHRADDVRIFAKECRTLARAGYQVHLVAVAAQDGTRDGVVVHNAGRRRGGRLRRMSAAVWSIYRFAVELDAELYHLHDPELLPTGVMLLGAGKRVVYDSHEDLPRDLLSKRYLGRARRLLSRPVELLENEACRRLSAIVAATPTIGDRFAAVNPRTIVVNNFPLIDEFAGSSRVEWADRARRIAYVGGISSHRGIAEAVEAMAQLPADLEGTLDLAGTFADSALREALTRTAGWRRVKEHGVLDRDGIRRLLLSARAGLVGFHPTPAQLAAQPIKMYEYMAAGIPVIASDFPLWRDLVAGAECGVLVDPLDPQSIAAAVEFVLMREREAEAMGRRGRELVEARCNWRPEGEKLVRLYDDLLDLRADAEPRTAPESVG